MTTREEDDIKAGAGADEEERGIRPVAAAQDADIKSVIDEAVEAVEAVTRQRDGEHDDEGNGRPLADADALQREVEQLRDRLMRTLADFDNYRKRVDRERRDERRYAVMEPLREVVGIIDNLERALAAEGDLEDLKTGVAMILRQMEDLLKHSGVESIAALDQEFDPAVHEAVSRVEDAQVDTPTVIDEMQRGYVLHERLLRPSIVRVAVPVQVDDERASDDEESAGTIEAED